MSMEKYGVSDVADQQREELDQVKNRISELEKDLDKTSSEGPAELDRLRDRAGELQEALRKQ